MRFHPPPTVLMEFTITLKDGSVVFAESVELIPAGNVIACTSQGQRRAFSVDQVQSITWGV